MTRSPIVLFMAIASGFTFYLQAFGIDPGAPHGLTSTPALEVVFGF